MEELMEKLVEILKKHGAKKVMVFGSYLRGEAGPESDLDVIVEFKDRKSLLELVDIDLPTRSSISPYLRDRIEKEAKVIF